MKTKNKPVNFKKIRGVTIILSLLLLGTMSFVAYDTAQATNLIVLAVLIGFILGLMCLFFKYLFIDLFVPLSSLLMLIMPFVLIIIWAIGMDDSFWFKGVLLFSFVVTSFTLTASLGATRSKADFSREKAYKALKRLEIENVDGLEDLISEINEFKGNGFYYQLSQQDFAKRVDLDMEKNNLLTQLDQVKLMPTPLTGEFVSTMEIEAMYNFLEKIYELRKGERLNKNNRHELYFKRLDESIMFALDKFDEVRKVPLINKDYLIKLREVKWDGENKEFFNELFEFKYNTLDYENSLLIPFKLEEKQFLEFLAACSAVSDNRGYIENKDFITAYKTYFKLIKTDITKLEPVKIDENKIIKSPIYIPDPRSSRYVVGGLFAILFITKYDLFFSQYPFSIIFLPLVIIIIVSYLSSDEYFSGISAGLFMGSIGSLPSIWYGFEEFTRLIVIYLVLGIIGGYIGVLIRRINEGKFNSSPKEIEKRERTGRGYLVCKECGGYYKLQPWESPDDFDKCQCGGDLRYQADID